jgi:O-antigen ligase
MLLLIVLLLVRQTLKHQVRNLALIGVALAVLVMTASRSGLLACLAFTALVLPRARRSWIVMTALAVAVAVPFIPAEYWTRIAKTLTLERGTFEAYTSIIRFYAWKTAAAVFLDHPWLGVGYLGFPSISGQYGELRLVLATAESYYLEVAADMGVPGLIALGFVIAQIFRLGRTVGRNVPVGSMAHAMSRFHAPMLVGIFIIAITGNHFIGMMGIGQLALWLAMLVRAGHLANDARPVERAA